jgi:hypothetical protein
MTQAALAYRSALVERYGKHLNVGPSWSSYAIAGTAK